MASFPGVRCATPGCSIQPLRGKYPRDEGNGEDPPVQETPRMPDSAALTETVLIVDDEEPVRRTFSEWLESAGLPCRILSAADAESALVQANQHIIDLAILDWNLGAGNHGLQLLEDLYPF